MSPWKYFGSRTVERSGPSASPGRGPSTRNTRLILEDLQNRKSLSPKATEGGRYSLGRGVPFTDPPFPVIESTTSPERRGRHRRVNAECRVPIILPLNLSSKLALPPSPNNMLGSALVDVLGFRSSKYDTSSEKKDIFMEQRSSSMVINHGNHDVDNIFSPLSLSPESSHTATSYRYNKALKQRRVPLNRRVTDGNALIFTVPPRSHTPPLSPPTAPSSPISDLVSKRSGRTFGLVPIQKDRFVHVVATDLTGGRIESSLDSPCLSSPAQYGLPPDMLAMLHELDELAKWTQDFTYLERPAEELDALTAPVSYPHALERLGDDNLDDHFLQQPALSDKGKGRRIEPVDDMDSWVSKEPQIPTSPLASSTPVAHRQSVRYIYDPRSSPLFLVGSSTSPVVYPAEGYHSPPRQSHCRSVPDASTPPLGSPLSGVISFKALFRRSRSNAISVPHTDALGKDKKIFGWLKI